MSYVDPIKKAIDELDFDIRIIRIPRDPRCEENESTYTTQILPRKPSFIFQKNIHYEFTVNVPTIYVDNQAVIAIDKFTKATNDEFVCQTENNKIVTIFKTDVDGITILASSIKPILQAFLDIIKQNLYVPTYDKESGVFIEMAVYKDALEKRMEIADTIPPDNLPYKLKDGKWELIYAVINEDGYHTIRPTSLCPRCIIFFTKEEWEAFPTPSGYDRYNVASGKWEDTRTVTHQYDAFVNIVVNRTESERIKMYGRYVPTYEQTTWEIQIEEMRALLKRYGPNTDIKDQEYGDIAPFIYARMGAYTGKKTLNEYLAEIQQNNTEYREITGFLNGMMHSYIEKARELRDSATDDRDMKVIIALDALSQEYSGLNFDGLRRP